MTELRIEVPEPPEGPAAVSRLSDADLIYLPGGDPDVIPDLLPASGAWRCPRALRVRSMSASPPDQSDLACRSTMRVRSPATVMARLSPRGRQAGSARTSA